MSLFGRQLYCLRHRITRKYYFKLRYSSSSSSQDARMVGGLVPLDCNKLSENNYASISELSNLTKANEPALVNGRRESKLRIKNGPGLKDFIINSAVPSEEKDDVPYVTESSVSGRNRKVYFEVYGCQMNVNDTEVVWSILKDAGYLKTEAVDEADVILMVTCAIREGAETKVWHRLRQLAAMKKIRERMRNKSQLRVGVLGCMAERLKHQLLEKEKAVDVVAGPDSYKDLPRLLSITENNQTAVNVLLSLDETYADITPVRLNQDAVTAFVTIMRGCDNMCTYCIVPFTRGRERSRPITSILEEVRKLSDQGVKEVTLLGQNVNSYRDLSAVDYYGGLPSDAETHLAQGFRTVYKKKKGGLRFADLLDEVSRIAPEMRIRFTSPHPKDFPDEVLELIRERTNVCSNLHMPAQSGNTAVLERMRRGYSREAYLDLIGHVRQMIPGVSISSDFICGFCGETEEEFEETLSLISQVKYNMTYLFAYSLREKTTAHRRLVDDVPPEVKKQRMFRMMTLYRSEVQKVNEAQIGQHQLVLVEGPSKRSVKDMAGRNDGNTKVVFPAGEIPDSKFCDTLRNIRPGEYVVVQIISANSQTLKGIPLYHSSLSSFSIHNHHGACRGTDIREDNTMTKQDIAVC